MTITQAPPTVHDVLAGAMALLSRPGGWTSGSAVRPTPAADVDRTRVTIAFCATAAIDVACGFRTATGRLAPTRYNYPDPIEGARRAIRREALQALVPCLPLKYREQMTDYGWSSRTAVEVFNDRQGEVGPVLAAFRCAIDNTEPPKLPLWKRLLGRTS